MTISKRIILFLLTNAAVIVVASFILNLLGIRPYLEAGGINYVGLLIFAAIFGFAGSFISLFLSKWMAKKAFNVQILDTPHSSDEVVLSETIRRLSQQVNIAMPEIGIYESPEPNAFATGWNKNKALVAVSTGLMDSMTREELDSVLGHEISHVANGDMVTLTLIQGVVNTFVIFFARIAAEAVRMFTGGDEEGGMGPIAYMITIIAFEIFFGILASTIVMWFSRQREFRADAGSAKLLGKPGMVAALKKLGNLQDQLIDPRGKAFDSMKIADKPSKFAAIFSSHPPIVERIKALQ